MPIYEYVCTACDHRADILHGIDDPGPNFCPSCGLEGTMKKQFAAPAIHYKGSGWAKKDRTATSRSARSTSKSDGDSGTGGGGDKKDSGSSDKGGSTESASSTSSSSPASD
jgi:putative FmdB family regulatory protein